MSHKLFNNVLSTFLGLECGSCITVYAGLEIVIDRYWLFITDTDIDYLKFI